MDPLSVNDILLLPAILMFFGVFVYGVALGNGLREYRLPRYRWAGLAILLVALLMGARYVYFLYEPGNSPFYRAQLSGKKVVLAHYVALALPLLLVAAIGGAEAWFKRHQRNML